MQWTDLFVVAADSKVAHRLTSAGDLRSFFGQVAIGPDAEALPELVNREGVWVSTTPMPETVKDVDADGLVRATVPREELAIVGYPIVAPSMMLDGSDPGAMLRHLLAHAESLQSLTS